MKMRTELAVVPALVFALLSERSSLGQGESRADPRGKDAVVLVTAEFGVGTPESGAGIIVSASREVIHIVTADHVVRPGGKTPSVVKVTFSWGQGKDVVASLLPKHDAEGDLAVLTVGAKAAALGSRTGADLVPRVRDPRSLLADESVIILGNPDGHPWQTYKRPEGFVALTGDRIEFESAHLRHGHSGGALYDADFQLVGMVFIDGGRTGGTTGYAQTVDSIEKRLRGWGYPSELRRLHRSLSAGVVLTCDAKAGRAICWGDTTFSETGPASTLKIEVAPIKTVAAGWYHACVLSREGQVYCLGANLRGQVGNGGTDESVDDATAIRTDRTFQSLTAGDEHTCALTANGSAYCWGCGEGGRLGDGEGKDSALPTAVAGPVRFVALTAGPRNTCGLTATGEAYCWGGINGTGAERFGADPPNAYVPRKVPGGLRFTSLSAGAMTCGLTGQGQLHCWGLTDHGDDAPRPLAPTMAFKSISVGPVQNICGVALDGRAFCWGKNDLGQLGNGRNEPSDTPVPVSGGLKFEYVSTSWRYSCGVTTGDAVYCWGELFDPSASNERRLTNVPVKLRDP